MIESRKIGHFLAVATHLNFTAAATQLNISQPALSRSIKHLEDQLGVPLLERLPTGVVLTQYGEILSRRARLIHLDAEHTLSEINALKTGSGGKLRIGAGPLWASVYLPPAVAELQRQHLGYQVEITSGVIDTLVPALLGGEIDTFCSSLDFPNHPELEKIRLVDVSHIIVARRAHPLAKKKIVAPDVLLEYPWITIKGDYVGRARLGNFFVGKGLEPPRSSTILGAGIRVVDMLSQGDYLTTIPAAILSTVRESDVAKIEIEATFWDSPAGIVYRKTESPLPILSSLIAILKSKIGDPELIEDAG